MKSRHARKIRRGVLASKLFWKEFGEGNMSSDRYKAWLAVLCMGGLSGKACKRTESKFRRRYRKDLR